MAMNQIQFQPGVSMPEFFERYGTEAKCSAALVALRWPGGFRCPRSVARRPGNLELWRDRQAPPVRSRDAVPFVFVQWGGVGAAKAKRVGVEFGSVGAAMAGELRVTQGFAGTVLAREATIEQGIVRTLVAQRVEIKRPSAVLVMIAQHVSGEVRPLLDWRGALAFGAAFGLVSGLVRAGRGRRNETVSRSR